MGDSSFRRHGLHNWAFCGRAKMPWKECNHMDERLKFIARLLDGEKMAVLCRQFGISRKTGYKILTRYNEIGLEGLTDRRAEDQGDHDRLRSRASPRKGSATSISRSI